MALPNGPYKSSDEEAAILKKWLESGAYKPEFNSETNQIESFEDMLKRDQETWSLITPPPNAYGRPHVGNISGYAYMDAMARYQRMQGKQVLVLPGKDHAGLEGEGVFVREVLEKQKRNKFDMDREEFYSEMMDWMQDNMQEALEDEKAIGLSADFDRNTFTLDPDVVETVLNTFVEMYKKGMIYKGVRIINYDIKGRTAVADNQIEYKDSETPFFYFKYTLGSPEKFAVKVKNDFKGQEIEWEYQFTYGDDPERCPIKTKFGYGEVMDKNYINPNDGDPLDVVGLGFYEMNANRGDVLRGNVVGIQMRLDMDYSIIVAHPDLNGEALDKEINEYFHFASGRRAGSHIIRFDEYPEDKYYTNGFIIGTVRPETVFADTAIACDPKDKRYKEFVGKEVEVEFLGEKKKLNFIEDYSVDKEFGTGLLKVTPAHAVEDWEISQRHPEECMPPIQVIGYDLRMNHLTGKYNGMRIKEARAEMREDMKASGNLVHVDDNYKNRIAIAERTKAPIEPLMSSQWYLKYDGIKEAAIDMVLKAHNDENNLTMSREEIEKNIEQFLAESNYLSKSGEGRGEVESGDLNTATQNPKLGTRNLSAGRQDSKLTDSVTLHPSSMVSQFNHWMDNLRDWAISRSLWWGYRLPVWYHGKVKEEIGEDGQVREYISLSKSGEGQGEVATTLDIIRHSQSEDNLNGLVSGSKSDTPLSENGVRDAKEFEPEKDYDLIITSTLKRAKQTTEIINEKLDLPVVESELIVEKDFGEIEGEKCDVVLERFPEYDTIYDVYDNPNKIGAESKQAVDERLEKFIEWVVSEYPGKKILVVCHGGVKKEFARILELMEESAIKTWIPANLEITTALVQEDNGWVPLEYDNHEHMKVQKADPDAIQIDVIRHGVTEENKKKIMQGSRLDAELSAENEELISKMERAGRYDYVFTSPMKRAKQTLELLLKHKKIEVDTNNIKTDELLVERDFGELTGKSFIDVAQQDFNGDVEKYFEEVDSPTNRYGAETLSSVSNRIKEFTKSLEVEKYAGKKILVVAHGGIQRAFENVADEKPYDEIFAGPRKENLNIDSFYLNHPKSTWQQDENVLDTWFSSGQWVYATLGKYGLMDKFFPTDVMVSGFDILENWISRMMMFTYFKKKEIPFRNVYLTGLVKGKDGQKMSKSKGNLINMDQVKEQYGTDAIRMVYYYQNSAGASYTLTTDKLNTFKKFINKIWNASKFVLMNLEDFDAADAISSRDEIGEGDNGHCRLHETKGLLDHIIQTKEHITKNIEDFDFGLATFNLYQAFWHEFADVHIEEVKKYVFTQKNWETGEIISEPDPEEKREAQRVLHFALREYLKMLHSFMPFVTERIWQEVPKVEGDHEYLMYSRW